GDRRVYDWGVADGGVAGARDGRCAGGTERRRGRRSHMSLGMEQVAERKDPSSRLPSPVSRLISALLPPATALLIAAVVGDILILTFGQSPADVFRLLIEGTWGNAYGLGQVIYKATTLTFTGLA